MPKNVFSSSPWVHDLPAASSSDDFSSSRSASLSLFSAATLPSPDCSSVFYNKKKNMHNSLDDGKQPVSHSQKQILAYVSGAYFPSLKRVAHKATQANVKIITNKFSANNARTTISVQLLL